MRKILFLMMASLVIVGCSKENIGKSQLLTPEEYPDSEFPEYDIPDLTNPYITMCQEDTNHVIISGLKNNCVWYGKFHRETKKLKYSHTDKDAISKVQVNMGYGVYKEIIPKYIRYGNSVSEDRNWVNMFFMCAHDITNFTSEDFYLRLDFWKEGNLIKSFIPVYNTRDYSTIYLRKWFNGSFLFAANDYVMCFAQDGSILNEARGLKIGYGDNIYPISLTKLIEVNTYKGLYITPYDIKDKITANNKQTIYFGDELIKKYSVKIISDKIEITYTTIDYQGKTTEHSSEITIKN